MFQSPKIDRRGLLAVGGAGLFSLPALAACEALSTAPKGGDEAGSPTSGGSTKEAPTLEQLVKEGTLPPLEQRLPQSPLIVPVERPGTYGGTGRLYAPGIASIAVKDRYIEYDHLMRWKLDYSGTTPNVAESVDVEEAGRIYTFHLRPGMRWSDGEPFTSADIEYAVNDVLLNGELNPVPPSWLVSQDPVHVEALDDRTIQFTFTEPNGLLLYRLAQNHSKVITRSPKHYLSEFHKDYAADIDNLIAEVGVADWIQLHQGMSDNIQNPELPTICAWKQATTIEQNRVVFKRNPYYWKTDPDGRQLPYIDEWEYEVIAEPETSVLKAMQGEIDLELSPHYLCSLQNKPVLARDREVGDYRFIDMQPTDANYLMVSLNLTSQNPRLRRIFQKRDFRVGLSYAIDRQEIIDSVFQGQAEPWQLAPREETPFYNDELAKQYTAFDIDKANEHLDRAGYLNRDDDGFRVDEDGQRVSFAIDSTTVQDYFVDVLNLVKGYWESVGVGAVVNNVDRSLYSERTGSANLHDAAVWFGDYGDRYGALLDPSRYLPFGGGARYATAWATWFSSDGKEGVEPSDAAKLQMDLYRQLESTVAIDEQTNIMKDILQIATEEFWSIGIALPTQGYGIITNRLRGVPPGMPTSQAYLYPGPSYPEQYYLSDDQ